MLDTTAYDRCLRWTLLLPAPRERVWSQWTTDEGLRSFFGADHRVDFHVGGRFEILFLLDAAPGKQGAENCRILRLEPPARLAFTWNAPPHLPNCRGQHTVVEVRLAEAGMDACLLELVHSGFGAGPEWDQTFAYFAAAWPRVLAALEGSLA